MTLAGLLALPRCDRADDKNESCDTGELVDLLLGTPLRIVGIIVGAIVVRWLVHSPIGRLVSRAIGLSRKEAAHTSSARRESIVATAIGERRRQRAETMGSVLRSIASFVILGMAFVMVLDEFGIPIGPLLASAGVAGVEVGFGAQSLVRDFLSGIFMILEDQYGVGDVIDVGGAVGTVEEVTLRVTQLRDANGVVWYVRNGEILRVGNQSQGWSTAIVDISVAYTEDIARVQDLLRATVEAVAAEATWADKILEAPNVAGVESVTGTAVTIRVTVRCVPTEHVALQRELRKRVKEVFDREGVAVPPPTSPPTTTAALPPQ